ncbi:folate-binding protein YgfZ [Mariniluteicoccus endophyticus]
MTAVRLEEGPDAGAVAHLGSLAAEQRLLESGEGYVDLGHRDVLSISGPDRLTWLHSLTTQHLEGLQPGEGTTAYVLSPQGHIEHVLHLVDDGEVTWAHTEPGHGQDLADWLQRMVFMRRVEVALRTPLLAVVWQPGAAPEGPRITRSGADSLGGHESFVPRDHLDDFVGGLRQAGLWAYEALRIAAGVPRVFLDTDHRTIPNELGVPGAAVHLDKGCYRGQETVARVHTLGKPPRRLTMLHLDGSVDHLPPVGSPVVHGEKEIGVVGTSARHHELGPIALALLKRNVPVDAELVTDGVAAAQEVVVDPDVGMHFRARLG